ncbi:GNAT family N-acetyltransferase [Desertifilum tharense]|uniref:GNAT family N-acetyltransferase n=1 Tax=Desertifilum tharense TaxID=1185873 RepID=UPI003F80365F
MSVVNSDYSHSTYCEPDSEGDCTTHFPYTVRVSRLEDVEQSAEILAESFHSRSGPMGYIYPLLRLGISEDLRNRVRSPSPHYVCLVAVETSNSSNPLKVAGTVEMGVRFRPGGVGSSDRSISASPRSHQQLYISNLAVKAIYRRQGIASALLQSCEQMALRWGCPHLYLHVLENNHQARRLYYRLGYRLHRIDWSWECWLFSKPRKLLLYKHLSAQPRAEVSAQERDRS